MNTIYVTKDGYAKLKKELDELKNVRRKEISARIEIAKDMGDLSENAEYHEAKDEQGFIEGRIMELEQMLVNAVIIEHNVTGCVNVGNTVRVSVKGKEKEYTIVGANEADPMAGRISADSPIGASLIGHKKGDIVDVKTPAGVSKCKIISVS